MTRAFLEIMLQESNDIESHYGEKVNTRKDFLDSLRAWDYLCDQKTLTNLEQIKTAHWLITHGQLPAGERGKLRSENGHEVSIAGRLGLPAAAVQDAMYQWLHQLPVRSPKNSHIKFEHIHPFVDGNGRIGRLIMYWQLKQIGQLNYANIVMDNDREEYYGWFR